MVYNDNKIYCEKVISHPRGDIADIVFRPIHKVGTSEICFAFLTHLFEIAYARFLGFVHILANLCRDDCHSQIEILIYRVVHIYQVSRNYNFWDNKNLQYHKRKMGHHKYQKHLFVVNKMVGCRNRNSHLLTNRNRLQSIIYKAKELFSFSVPFRNKWTNYKIPELTKDVK